MSPEKAFGEVIRQLRSDRGLSQERLAADSGLDRTFISHLERGTKSPTLTTIFQIATGLKVTVSDLIAAVESKVAAPTD